MPISARQKLTSVFRVDYDSELDDRNYQGTFTCKKMSIQDKTKQAVVKTQLNGGMHYDPKNPGYGLDEETDRMNGVLAHLAIALTDAPDWWNLDEISDLAVIYEVYKEVAEHEASFRRGKKANRNNAGSASAGDSNSEDRASNRSGASSTVVDEEVQAALEP